VHVPAFEFWGSRQIAQRREIRAAHFGHEEGGARPLLRAARASFPAPSAGLAQCAASSHSFDPCFRAASCRIFVEMPVRFVWAAASAASSSWLRMNPTASTAKRSAVPLSSAQKPAAVVRGSHFALSRAFTGPPTVSRRRSWWMWANGSTTASFERVRLVPFFFFFSRRPWR
jgi:hypothetical protein